MYITDLVSIVIPTRGRTDTLGRALKSILNQTYRNIEIIVVNDNDPDSATNNDVKEIIESLNDSRVKLVYQQKHINGAAARNVGIRMAKGEYISFLDDDDWIEPVKIEHQMSFLKKQDSSVGAVSCLKKYYSKGKLVSISLPYKDGYICKEVISRIIGIGTGASLIRRTALDDSGYFDESLRRMQDIQLYACLCSKYKIILLKEFLYCKDEDDAQHRPGVETVIKIKSVFLESVKSITDGMNKEDQEFIKLQTDFEIGFCHIRDKNFKIGFPYIIRIFKQRQALISALGRISEKLRAKYLKNYYLRKFNVC